MKQKTFNLTAGAIFGLVAVIHLLRMGLSWSLTIEGWAVPLWISVVPVIVAGYLCWTAFQLKK